jgi:Lrp/AsnC family transcriptional regulator
MVSFRSLLGRFMQSSLDTTDLRILRLLQHDASLSAAELADKIGLSQSPCWRRVQRLEQRGYIRARVALLDPQALGLGFVAFVSVSLSEHGRHSLAGFEDAVREFPEVVECYTVTGQMDYLLKVVTRDIKGFEQFIRQRLTQLEGVREMHSQVAVTEIKCTTELPLG